MEKLQVKSPLVINTKEGLMAFNLFDELMLSEGKEDRVKITSTGEYKIRTNKESPLFKVTKTLQKQAKGKRGISIEVYKKIPSFSGLKSQLNAAINLGIALNQAWEINLDEKSLDKLLIEAEPKLKPLLETNKVEEKGIIAVLLRPKYIRNETHLPKEEMQKRFPDLKLMQETLLELKPKEVELVHDGPVLYALFEEGKEPKTLVEKLNQKVDLALKVRSFTLGS